MDLVKEVLLGRLGQKLHHELRAQEEVRLSLNGTAGQALVVTSERFIIIKGGFLSTFSAGTLLEPVAYSFRFDDVKHLKAHRNGNASVLELQTGDRKPLQSGVDPNRLDNVVSFPGKRLFGGFDHVAESIIEWIQHEKLIPF